MHVARPGARGAGAAGRWRNGTRGRSVAKLPTPSPRHVTTMFTNLPEGVRRVAKLATLAALFADPARRASRAGDGAAR